MLSSATFTERESRDDTSQGPDRLATVHIDASVHWRGAQNQGSSLALNLARRGHPTAFICPPHSMLAQRLGDSPVALYEVPMRLWWGLPAIARLTRLLRCLRPTVVHLHESVAHTLGSLAARLAGVPVVVVSKRADFPGSSGFLTRWRFERLVDRVIAVSDSAHESLLQRGVSAHTLVTIYSSVDCETFHPDRDDGGLRRELRLDSSTPVIVAVGQLIHRKGHDILLNAAPEIFSASPMAHLLLCGSGPKEQLLRQLTRATGLEGRVHFLGYRKDTRPAFAAAQIAVMPSRAEALGVAALEAMAMGKPLIASAVGGLREAIRDGHTGLLVPPEDPQALAAAVIRLLRQPAEAAALGCQARAWVEAHFSHQVMADKTLDLYREILAQKMAHRGGSEVVRNL